MKLRNLCIAYFAIACLQTSLGASPLEHLHSAIASGNETAIQQAIDAGAEVNAFHSRMDMPLLHAARLGNLSVVKLLVNRGAEVNGQGRHTMTVLHWSLIMGHCPVADYLLSRGADADHPTDQGHTPLMLSRKECPAARRIILGRARNINAVDLTGKSALFFAVEKQDLDFARQLLQRRIDVSITDADGKTALDYASSTNNASMVQLLQRHQPRP